MKLDEDKLNRALDSGDPGLRTEAMAYLENCMKRLETKIIAQGNDSPAIMRKKVADFTRNRNFLLLDIRKTMRPVQIPEEELPANKRKFYKLMEQYFAEVAKLAARLPQARRA